MKKNTNQFGQPLPVKIAMMIAVVILVLGMITATTAQDVPPGDEEPAVEKLDACKQHMNVFLNKKEIEFGEFINEHFKSDQPTSDLIPIAIEKFRRIRTEVRTELKVIYQESGEIMSGTGSQLYGCQQLIDQHFAQMKEVLREHIISNAYAKKTTRLMDKYKRINDQLSGMNFKIAQLYGYFSTFSQKLPCFADKCVN